MEREPSSQAAGCIELATDDIEALFNDSAGEGWELEYLQLTPGPLGAWYRIVPLSEMTIHWYRCRARLHVREYHYRDEIYLSFLIRADEPLVWRGVEVAPDQALLYFPEQEHDYVLPANIRFMGLSFSRGLARRMGWNLPRVPALPIDRGAIRAVAAEAARITAAVRSGTPPDRQELEVMQERLALRLDRLLVLETGDGHAVEAGLLQPDRLHGLAEAAHQEMTRMGLSEKLNIQELAARLSTSTRSLYRAFRHCFGVGPYEYHTLLRYRAFRSLVRSAGLQPGVITRTAVTQGFTHLGRFASAYRAHYGELPRETLRRWTRG